jgi:hypothetical protein
LRALVLDRRGDLEGRADIKTKKSKNKRDSEHQNLQNGINFFSENFKKTSKVPNGKMTQCAQAPPNFNPERKHSNFPVCSVVKLPTQIQNLVKELQDAEIPE